MKCKIDGCDQPIMTKPDKTKPSCNWFRFSDKVSEVVMFTSKPCSHGLCYYHHRQMVNEKLRPKE
jgi:hypothetical protein